MKSETGNSNTIAATLNHALNPGISKIDILMHYHIVTHPKIFRSPSSIKLALKFAREIRDQPNCVVMVPGERHGDIFCRLCADTGAKGNLVADAYLAALAIESGSEWITTDRDYSRFPGLRWRHPLAL